MIRKLSTIPLKSNLLLRTPRGETMKFKEPCPRNPKVLDDYYRDEEGFEHLVKRNHEKKEPFRY